MKIKKTSTGFTDIVDIGRFAFFIDINNNGVEIDNKELAKQASHFNRVVFRGEEPFSDRDEIKKVIKNIINLNQNVKIEIHTKGTIHPLGIGNFNNIRYNVFLRLKSSKIKYKERIIPEIIMWFQDMNAKFIFEISSEDDYDESMSLITDMGIKKQQVFLLPKNNMLKPVLERSKKFGYNFTLPLEVEFK